MAAWWLASLAALAAAGCIGEQSGRFTTRSMWVEPATSCPSPEEALATLDGPNVVGVERLVSAERYPRMCCYVVDECYGADYEAVFGVYVTVSVDAPFEGRETCFMIEEGLGCPAAEALPIDSYSGDCVAPTSGPREVTGRGSCRYRVEMDW